MSLHVLTFGGFDIRRSDNSLIRKSKRSQRYLELLEYFITNRGKKLSSENIIGNLWSDSESADPQNVLRTQIFRIRKLLKDAGLSGSGAVPGETLDIVLENGFYSIKTGENCLIDADIFENAVNKGDNLKNSDPDAALERYISAFSLYKGEYLEGNGNSEWMFVIRNRYNRLFIQTTLRMLELLKLKARWREIVEYFERAVVFEPLEESLHLYYLEALVGLGEFKNALSHYNYITGRILKELAVKPSAAFRSLYNMIVTGEGKTPLRRTYTACARNSGERTRKRARFSAIPSISRSYTTLRKEKA